MSRGDKEKTTKISKADLDMIRQTNEMLRVLMPDIQAGGARYLDINGAAKFISRTKGHLHKIKSKIGYSQPDGRITFDKLDLIAFMERTRVQPQ